MKHLFMKLSFVGVVMLNSACAPINTQFSCNATAGDRCLSIEEVNAMTEVNEVKKPIQVGRISAKQTRLTHNSTQTIWIAPWTDEKGVLHTNDTLFASTEGVRHVG
ncbi:MAG: hypothetical protein A3F46_05715 [Legionellales bacterium RIFCSPHIGHO2_12_FULL_42_9]|nr:MAG: hypothetical protein A3F46_05715 [Legionellales bacterium RIFCSPHIGHO2_12_FULL_42_9]